MREIKMQPVPDGDLRSPSDKHELHITRGSMTNVVSLTDDELAALRAELAAYRSEVHNGHYGAPLCEGCGGALAAHGLHSNGMTRCPRNNDGGECTGTVQECRVCEGESCPKKVICQPTFHRGCVHNPDQHRDTDYGAPDHSPGAAAMLPDVTCTIEGHCAPQSCVDHETNKLNCVMCSNIRKRFYERMGQAPQNPAYGAPLCTPGRRIDHEHSVACGPMAGECVTPGHVHVHPESTVRADNGCVTYGAPGAPNTRYGPTGHPIDPVVCINALGGTCGPPDCVLDHAMDASPVVTYSTVRDILRDVQAEVDAFVVGTGTQTLPYVEVIRMIRRVAVARGTAL